MDTLTQAQRSEVMGRIRSRDTTPEMIVRRLVHGMGYRYRLHAKDLPGKPDIVFRSRKKAIFVHGCFWHQHSRCREGRLPSSRTDYWKPKLEKNVERDLLRRQELARLGWRVLVVWECEINQKLERRISRFLG